MDQDHISIKKIYNIEYIRPSMLVCNYAVIRTPSAMPTATINPENCVTWNNITIAKYQYTIVFHTKTLYFI